MNAKPGLVRRPSHALYESTYNYPTITVFEKSRYDSAALIDPTTTPTRKTPNGHSNTHETASGRPTV